MEFLINHANQNHQSRILELLQESDEVLLATAFLKESGLSKLYKGIESKVKSGKSVVVIAGQNFALTEPKSLYRLRELFSKSNNCKVFLAHADRPSEVFHPKITLFKQGEKGFILTGSANITGGGLSTNFECSILVNCSTSDQVWLDAVEHFTLLKSPRVSLPASLYILRRYEAFYNSQLSHNKRSKSIPDKTKSEAEFEYENLLRHFAAFNNNNREQLFNERQDQYREAKSILNQIADSNLTKEEFSKLLERLVGASGIERLWHSGSLFRLRNEVKKHQKGFSELVRYIKSNQHKSISEIFDGAKSIVKQIKGAAANYIAEIMMTYNPVECANINRNPITVLTKAGGVNLKSHSSQFNGKDYLEFCTIVKDISELLTLRNMLEADTFFNEVYWKIKD